MMKEELIKILTSMLQATNNIECNMEVGNYAERFVLQDNIQKMRKLHNIDLADIIDYMTYKDDII